MTSWVGSKVLEKKDIAICDVRFPNEVEAIQKALRLSIHLKTLGFAVDRIDIGGGLGIDYEKNGQPILTPKADSSRAISLMGLQGACIGNGILTVENRAQAEVRADPAGQNKGGGAAAAALHLVALSRKWAGKTKGIGFRA